MKKLLLLLPFILLSCSTDENETPNRDLVVFHSTTFVSEAYDANALGVLKWRDVIKFKDNGSIEYFTVDNDGDIDQRRTHSTTGSYKLDYPRVYQILAVDFFNEITITIFKNGDTMSFNAGSKTFKNSLENFD